MKAKDPNITQAELKELLHYDPEVGEFSWRQSGKGRKTFGYAGCQTGVGYIKLTIHGRHVYAHRLAWFYTYGVWPTHRIDHIDTDKGNNRLSNLREATDSQNQANHSGLGAEFKNIFCLENGRFRVTVQKGGYVYNKTVDTIPQAIELATRVRIELHGEFARHQ